jgi:hypothetical protein
VLVSSLFGCRRAEYGGRTAPQNKVDDEMRTEALIRNRTRRRREELNNEFHFNHPLEVSNSKVMMNNEVREDMSIQICISFYPIGHLLFWACWDQTVSLCRSLPHELGDDTVTFRESQESDAQL